MVADLEGTAEALHIQEVEKKQLEQTRFDQDERVIALRGRIKVLTTALEDAANSLDDLTYLRKDLAHPEKLLKMHSIWDEAERRLASARNAIGK